ncbi:MAG: hypothetical protein NUV50_08985 [Rhodospirillales bacterium]|nr:hypothetical protein [Rhodospirillales bacterium]
MTCESILAENDEKPRGGSQPMFVNDLENYITYDAERDIKLSESGRVIDEAGKFFVLFLRDIKVPFQAQAEFIQMPSREWWWIDWTILSMGGGPYVALPDEPTPRFRTSFRYTFTSADEEWEVVGIIKEALRVYGDCYGTTKADVRHVVIAEDAWAFPENRARAELS